ncbi:MAG: hypothetical protein R6U56_05225 [Opitutales bacterium]
MKPFRTFVALVFVAASPVHLQADPPPEWPASYPSWWWHADPALRVIDIGQLDDQNNTSPGNQGQAKWMATRAVAHLNDGLASIGGAGFALDDLLDPNADSAHYAPINLGQLKNLAAPFYDRLHAVGFNDWPDGMTFNASGYPWTENVTPQNLSPANLGQLKFLFGWVLPAGFSDPLPGELPQWWLNHYFPDQTEVDLEGNTEGDEYSNYVEYLIGSSPVQPNSSSSETSPLNLFRP